MGSIQKRLKYALLAPLFVVSTFVMQFANISFVSAATVSWDGEGGNNNFSTAANWSGDAVPQLGDDLVFPSAAGADEILVNDLGVSFASITVNGGGGSAGSYTIDTLSLQDGAVIEVDTGSGTDTTLNIGTVTGAGSVEVDGEDLVSITTSLGVTTDLTVTSGFSSPDIDVGGNLVSSADFTSADVAVTGNATFDTTVPTITALSAANLTSDVALTLTSLTLTGDFLEASTGSLNVSGTFATASDYVVSKAFTAGTFNVGGDLTVDVEPTVTTLTVAGDLTINTDLDVTTLNLTGDYEADSTGALTVSGTFTTTSDYMVGRTFTAGTFNVGGNLTVGSVPYVATTTGVTGNLVNSGAFTPGALTVGGNITLNESFTAASLNLTGDLATAYQKTLTVTGNMAITGNVSGSGSLYVGGTLSSSDDLTVASTSGNVTASIVDVDGDLQLNADMYSPAQFTVSGDVTVGDPETYAYGTIVLADESDITGTVTIKTSSSLTQDDAATISLGKLIVQNGASAQLNGTIDFPVEFGSGKSKSTPSLTYNTYTSEWDGDLEKWLYDYSTLAFTGDTTLKNDLRVHVFGDKTSGKVEFNGDITYNGFSIKKSNSSTGKLYIDGKEVKNPVITTDFNGDKYNESETVTENETATLNGNRNSITVYTGGTLKGEGSAVSGNFYYDATLSPGNSPGTITFLRTLTLQEDAVLYSELKNTDEYDQVVVGEDYDGSGNAVSIDGAVLTLALYDGYSMKIGDEFTLIDNRSETDVDGTFSGLAEGATINLGGGSFTISYEGGDGNDVVITVTKVPTATVGVPNTGVLRLITANPALSLILGLTTAGMLMLIARRKFAFGQIK